MVNMSSSNNSTPRSTSHQSSPTSNPDPVTRLTINEFREIIREQSFVLPNNSSSEQVSVKRYPPLPDIHGANPSPSAATTFRTESVLPMSTGNPPKKQTFYHFSQPQRGHLAALNTRPSLPTVSNMMDLDEDLPQCYSTVVQRTATYTSPNDRMASPIKRPSAPSPPASAHVKRGGQNAFVYTNKDEDDDDDDENFSGLEDDDDDSHSFDEQSYPYNPPPVTMMSRRMDDCNQDKSFNNTHHAESLILIDTDRKYTCSFTTADSLRAVK